MGSESLIAPIRGWRRNLGQIIAPEVAALLARSLTTLVVRVRAHNENAERVARFLARHPRVGSVRHPSLLDGPDAALVASSACPSGWRTRTT